MEYSYEKLTDRIYVCASSDHRFGTDAFLLAHFSQYRMKDKVCDLGTGCGIIPLIMQKSKPPQVTYAVDIQEGAIEQLRLGLERSETTGIVPVCADLKVLWDRAPLGQLDLVTCNPPYKVAGAGFESVITAQKIARHEILCDINDVCASAAKLLKFGGRLCLCNRPERLSDVMFAMKSNGIEPKRLRMVSKSPADAPWLFLIEGKKGSKPFMRVEPQLYIRSGDGFSEELQMIYDTGKEEK
ncbi:MAG: methyltransferase [Ruminococcus sp.]|nr:methyltransferase [Ruminococcus sp.]